MFMNLNWAIIRTGEAFQALVNTLLQFELPGIRVFGRAGKDAGLDAQSKDGKIAYQYKYHLDSSFSKVMADANSELEKITKYRNPTHKNYFHWQHATEWILITNVPVNPNDSVRWNNNVVPAFGEIGLAATLWSAERLNELLTKHPQVAHAYFEGQNRCFLSLGEAYEFTSADEIGESGLNVALVGRDSELAKAESFLAGEKKLLVLHGPGGIGKSRLLLELGARAEMNGFQVLWGAEATMSATSQWFSAVEYTLPTLLLLDEPQDPEVIDVLTEQLRIKNGPAQTWKVILAVRSPNDPVLKAVSNMPGAMKEPALVLEPLSREHSKTLSMNLINSSPLSSRPQDQKENIADRLSKLGDRYPIWIAIAVNVLAKHNDLSSLPTDANDIANKYLDEVVERGTTHASSAKQILETLRWLAIYEEIDVEDLPLLNFLSIQAGFADSTAFLECLNSLVRRKFAIRRGVNQRLYSIKPDVMREHIVRNWLVVTLDGPAEPTPAAKKLVNLIIQGHEGKPVPALHTLIRGLAKAEFLTSLQTTKIDFLSPLIAEIKKLAQGGTTIEQQVVLGLIHSFDFARLSDVVDIMRILRMSERPPAEFSDFFGHKHQVTHQEIISELAWPLFNAARYARTDTEVQGALNEMVEISIAEGKIPELSENGGKRAHALIPRMISGENNLYSGFAQEAFGMATKLASKLKEPVGLDESSLGLTKVVCSPFLSIERERTTFSQRALTMHKWFILPGSPEGAKRSTLRSTIRECLLASDAVENCRLASWSLLSHAHAGANRARLRPDEGSTNKSDEGLTKDFVSQIENDIKADLKWAKSTLEARKRTLKELRAARSLWEWHVNFEKDQEIKALALDCERIYEQNPLAAAFHAFFSHESYELVLEKAREIGDRLGSKGTSAQIHEFLQQAKEFAPEKTEWSNLLEIPKHIASHWNANPQIAVFVAEALATPPDDIEFGFAASLLNHRLKELRNEGDQEKLKAELNAAEKALSATNENLVSFLYARPHPLLTGILTSTDLEFVRSQIATHTEALPPWLKCKLLAGMFHVNWELVKQSSSEIFFAAAEADRLRCFLNLLDAMRFLGLFAKDYPVLALTSAQYEWLLGLMISLPDIDKINDHAQWELQQLVETFGRKDLQWLVSIIDSRITEAGKRSADEKNDYKAIPTRHRLTKYVTPISGTLPVPARVKELLLKLLSYTKRKDVVGYILPEYAQEIDPNGAVLPELIEERIGSSAGDKEEIWVWTRFAGHYGFNSQPWRKIAKAAIQAAQKFSTEDRVSIFVALLPQEFKMSNFPAGEMDPRPGQELEQRRREMKEETDTTILSFRQWHLAMAQAQYDQTVARYKEENEL
jgi:hypothetical protein